MFLYLDTSALVKRYVAEARSDDVIALMNDTPAAGTALITQTEIAAALVRARREGRLSRDEARQAHGKFLQEWQDLGRVPITNALLTRADTVAWTHELRAYDAVQLAAALTCQDTIAPLGEDVMFACFDNQLRGAAGAAGLQTWPDNPAQRCATARETDRAGHAPRPIPPCPDNASGGTCRPAAQAWPSRRIPISSCTRPDRRPP